MRAARRRVPVVAAVVAAAMSVATGAAAMASSPKGIDVASFQHPHGAAINWTAAHADGIAFAFVKATESTGYVNPWFADDRAAARSAGVAVGAYHFARPTTTPGSAAAQAQAFLAAAGRTSTAGDLPPMLDLEVSGGLTPAQLVAWTTSWLSAVSTATGRTPIIYTGPNFWRTALANSAAFTGYPLFIAHYGVAAPSVPGGWRTWTFWQQSSTGRVGGIVAGVDTDVYAGSPADLDVLARRPVSTPRPSPVPTPTPAPTPAPTQGPVPLQAAPPRPFAPVRLSEYASTTSSRPYRPVRISGSLRADGRAMARISVVVYSRAAGTRAWRPAARVVTDASGVYRAVLHPSRTVGYRAVSAAKGPLRAAASRALAVQITR